MQKKNLSREFDNFLRIADANKDMKLDRWELYNYCLTNMEA